MPHLSLLEFEALIATLDEPSFRTLVEELWAGLDWETTRCGDDILLRRHDRPARRVRPVRERPGSEPFDGGPVPETVVSAYESETWKRVADHHGCRYVGPSELYRILRYGLEREEADELLDRHADYSLERHGVWNPGLSGLLVAPRPLLRFLTARIPPWNRRQERSTGVSIPAGASNARAGWAPRGGVSRRTGKIAGVLVLILATLGVGYGMVLAPSGPGDAAASNAPEPGLQVKTPPGIRAGDLRDVGALGRAHRAALADRSYRLTITYAGARGLVLTGFRWRHSRQRLRVTAAGQFSYRVRGTLPPETVGATNRSRSFAITGNRSDCRRARGRAGQDGPTTETPCRALDVRNPSTLGGRIGVAALQRYLVADATTVRRIETVRGPRFLLVSTVPPETIARAVEDYRATAIVRPSGSLAAVRVRYRLPRSIGHERVRFTLRYRRPENGTATAS